MTSGWAVQRVTILGKALNLLRVHHCHGPLNVVLWQLQDMVVASRLVLDDMTTLEAMACVRSLYALNGIGGAATTSYLRRRILAAATHKGYMAFT